jgi:hypothetical protein
MWAESLEGDQKSAMVQIVETSRTLQTVDGLCMALRTLISSPMADQVAVALAMKSKAQIDPSVSEGVWEVLSDAEWRSDVLGTIEQGVLGLLFDAFLIFQVNEGGKWSYSLLHFMVQLCEAAESADRREVLFYGVIQASLAADSVSAIRRLLSGSEKSQFVELVANYRQSVETTWPRYPRWVQGRLRGLLASLRVA